MLSSQQVSSLGSIYRSDTWNTLRALREGMILNWQERTLSTETEFSYLSESLKRDGRIEGITLYLQEIERLIQQNQNQ